jgi:two-component system phosphate regulon sensor histidine kinase PhoR
MERARKRAVSHLSHELTTPLAIVMASVPKLVQQDLSRERKQKILERITRNLKRLNDIQEIVQDIIERHECNPAAFPVIPITHQILDEIRRESSHRLVHIIPRLEDLDEAFIDPSVFRKVLRTLVKNAIENTPDEGQVVVTLEKVPLGVVLKVSDQGVGIAEADRPFVFEAFHHTQKTYQYSTRNPYDFDAGGKGLELMHLKMLAEEGCFDLWFESQRCRHIDANEDSCPGRISACKHVADTQACAESGGTTFHVLFREPQN